MTAKKRLLQVGRISAMSASSLQLTGSHKRIATHSQGDLLETALADNHKLMEALDHLNARYGRGAVKVSTQGAYSGWQMKQERKSPNYTTSWDDVPLV